VFEQKKKQIFDVLSFFKSVVILQDNVTWVCMCACVRARIFVCVFMTVCPSPFKLLHPWTHFYEIQYECCTKPSQPKLKVFNILHFVMAYGCRTNLWGRSNPGVTQFKLLQ